MFGLRSRDAARTIFRVYEPPVLPTTLPGTLWAISAYFNPAGYHNRERNFRLASTRLRAQGVPLIVVEAALHDAPFFVRDEDADIVIRLRTGSILWHKERLLNIGMQYLPDDCDKVLWTDADVWYLNPEWPTLLSKALERHVVVQPFRDVQQGPQGYVPPSELRMIDRTLPGECGQPSAYCCSPAPGETRVRALAGHPGYACAARRRVLESVGGLYEYMIVGGGDSLFLGACYGIRLADNNYVGVQKGPIRTYAEPWCDALYAAVQGSVGSIDNELVHLWHGDRKERFYIERPTLISTYDPHRDLVVHKNACLEWSDAASAEMKRDVELYFMLRNEDGNTPPSNELRFLREKLIPSRPEATNQAHENQTPQVVQAEQACDHA